MSRKPVHTFAFFVIALALGGCAGADLDVLLGAQDAPMSVATPQAAPDPQRLWEAAAASDAMRLIEAEFGAQGAEIGDPSNTQDANPPILAVDPRGGLASAALADAAARTGYQTAIDCAAAESCVPIALDVALLGQGSVLARLDVDGVLQASWAYRIEGASIAPATGFTIGRRLAESDTDSAPILAQAIR